MPTKQNTSLDHIESYRLHTNRCH